MPQVVVLNGLLNNQKVVIVLPDDKGNDRVAIRDKDLPDPYQFLESEERPTTGSNLMDKLIDLLP